MSGDCDLCGSYDHVEAHCDDAGFEDPTDRRLVVRSVPASIPRSRVLDFVESLGIKTHMVHRDTGIVLGWDAIRCRVIAEDKDGEPYADVTGTSLAMHDICIPIVEDRP